jgi:hypothetical protein
LKRPIEPIVTWPQPAAAGYIAEYAENAPNPEPVTYSFPNLDGEPITVTIHNPSSIHHRE